jgi:hypothetical protein
MKTTNVLVVIEDKTDLARPDLGIWVDNNEGNRLSDEWLEKNKNSDLSVCWATLTLKD